MFYFFAVLLFSASARSSLAPLAVLPQCAGAPLGCHCQTLGEAAIMHGNANLTQPGVFYYYFFKKFIFSPLHHNILTDCVAALTIDGRLAGFGYSGPITHTYSYRTRLSSGSYRTHYVTNTICSINDTVGGYASSAFCAGASGYCGNTNATLAGASCVRAKRGCWRFFFCFFLFCFFCVVRVVREKLPTPCLHVVRSFT